MTGTRLSAGALVALLVPISTAAQQPGLSGYYLNVGTHVAESLLGSAGSSDVQRLRVIAEDVARSQCGGGVPRAWLGGTAPTFPLAVAPVLDGRLYWADRVDLRWRTRTR